MGESSTVKKTTCQNLWIQVNPNSFMNLSASFFAASAAKIGKCDISSASEKAFPGVFGDFLVAELPPKEVF
jgi:hypothetical protein